MKVACVGNMAASLSVTMKGATSVARSLSDMEKLINDRI